MIRLGEIASGDPGPAERVVARRRRDIVAAALDELPDAQRKALDLAYFDDLTHERIAATWTSLGTVSPDAAGSARLIAEAPVLAILPDAAMITREPAGGAPMPGSHVLVAWTP